MAMAENAKYDTNPLDPGFAQRAEEEWEATRRLRPDTDAVEQETRHLRPERETEPTQHKMPPQYQSPAQGPDKSLFTPPQYQPPATHGPHPYPLTVGAPSSRPVAGLHLPEKLLVVLPYAPAYIGIVAAFIELFFVPRTELRVRFHAAQGLTLQLVILAISMLFRIIGFTTGSYFGGGLFSTVAFVFLIVSMIRVWKGKSHHLPALDEGTKWVNEHIDPKTK